VAAAAGTLNWERRESRGGRSEGPSRREQAAGKRNGRKARLVGKKGVSEKLRTCSRVLLDLTSLTAMNFSKPFNYLLHFYHFSFFFQKRKEKVCDSKTLQL
jgi:hypothetical protein